MIWKVSSKKNESGSTCVLFAIELLHEVIWRMVGNKQLGTKKIFLHVQTMKGISTDILLLHKLAVVELTQSKLLSQRASKVAHNRGPTEARM